MIIKCKLAFVLLLLSLYVYGSDTTQKHHFPSNRLALFIELKALSSSFDSTRHYSINESKKALDRARLLMTEQRDPQLRAVMSELEGDYAMLHGEFAKAYQYYLSTYGYLNTQLPGTWMAKLRLKLGHVCLLTMRFEQAYDHLFIAKREFALRAQKQGQLHSIILLAEFYRKLGQFEKALQQIEKAKRFIDDTTDTQLRLLFNSRLSAIWNETGKHDAVVELCEESLMLTRSIGNIYHEAVANNELGFVYEKTGEEDAKSYYTSAIHLFEELGTQRYQAGSLINLIRYSILQNEMDEAKRLLIDVTELARDKDWLIIERDILMYGLMIAEKQKNFEQAYKLQKEFYQLDKQILESERDEHIFEVEHQFELRQKETQIINQKKELHLNKLIIQQKEKNFRFVVLTGILFLLVSGLLAVMYASIRRHERRLLFTNAQLEKTIKEKEALVKEIHHRVKNNLNMLSGILLLERNSVKDTQAQQVIMDIQSRLDTLSLVHQQMLHPDDNPSVHTLHFFSSFIDNIRDSYNDKQILIRDHIHCNKEEIPIRMAIPIALISNELITNALKHAKPRNEEALNILFKLQSDAESIHLLVQDNGTGLDHNDQHLKADSVGFKLIHLLAEQLDAVFDYISDPLPQFHIHLNYQPYDKA